MIPAGQVASYGMIASLIPGVTARMVGYALAATVSGAETPKNLPWQRVINSQGRLSIPGGADRQRTLLEAEGISFTATGRTGRISFRQFGWNGPEAELLDQWLEDQGMDMMTYLTIKAGWPS